MAANDMYTDAANAGTLCVSIYGEQSMPRFIDRTGFTYGRLTVVARAGSTANKKVLWECLCDCGNTAFVDSCALATGNTTSCGCYLHERITKHGGWKKSSYNTWRAMLRRCNNPKDKDYITYGAVGVTVCPEWHEYLVFAKDMGEPEGAQTLDRRDTYGNYTKDNCRWASPSMQCRNTRLRAGSKSGHTGVVCYRNGWYASIRANGRAFYSKVVYKLEEAVLLRKQLELRHWGA